MVKKKYEHRFSALAPFHTTSGLIVFCKKTVTIAEGRILALKSHLIKLRFKTLWEIQSEPADVLIVPEVDGSLSAGARGAERSSRGEGLGFVCRRAFEAPQQTIVEAHTSKWALV